MARMPKAPGLCSTSAGWPRIGRICSPTMRMTMSVALPGPNGTMTLTGFDGYLSCAGALTAPSTMQEGDSRARLIRCIFVSPFDPERSIRHDPDRLRKRGVVDDFRIDIGA